MFISCIYELLFSIIIFIENRCLSSLQGLRVIFYLLLVGIRKIVNLLEHLVKHPGLHWGLLSLRDHNFLC